jgi:3-hydroxyisobutyrate dehydrogenase-like beta-hydroxyacid dehydrogenase
MLGTKELAEYGTLVPLVSGPGQAGLKMRPVFDAIGGKTIHAGDRIVQALR